MKKFTCLFLSAVLGLSLVAPVFAMGENEDEQISCDAVNQQSHKDQVKESVSSQEASSSSHSASSF